MCDFTFEKVNPYSVEHFREMQLNELKGPVQDSIEEGIITYKADFVRILKEKELIGYACIGTYEYYKDIILDYFIISKYRSNAGTIIEQLARYYKCKEWLVNTHDFFALPVMLDLRLPFEIDAYKFANDESTNVDYEFNSNEKLEVTKLEELEEVYKLIVQDDFYSGGEIETLKPRIEVEELYSLRIDGRLIGIGFIGVLKRTPTYADIAMIIDRNERHKGYGVLIVKALINRCKLLNITPTAVCDAR
jgi:predicted acetyltransferase